MRKILPILFLILGLGMNVNGQTFNQDSVFQVVLEKIPTALRAGFKVQYDSASVQERAFMLFFLSMPSSSKAEQIKNIALNLTATLEIKEQYSKLFPHDLSVYIEFNPEEKLTKTRENVDIRIMKSHENENPDVLCQEWNLDYNSQRLDSVLSTVNLDQLKLLEIKRQLYSINCISIENGNPATIGFARSGMGKYSYKIFDQDLSPDQVKMYNDGCTYIFYKNNIVLEYGGGAVGPQCFPDEN